MSEPQAVGDTNLSVSRVLHITDNHLFSDSNSERFGVHSIDSLRQVLADATAQYEPEVVLVTGDVAQDVVEEVYQQFAEELQQFISSPIVATPGNHDLNKLFRKYLPNSATEINGWRIVAVDTHEDHQLEGYVSEYEMKTLKDYLKESDQPTLVVGHHPALPVGCDWIDPHRVKNGEALIELLKRYTQVKCFLTGHVHQAHQNAIGGLEILSTPSTCWQFKPQSKDFAIDDELAGWRWLSLRSDGSFETSVHRLSAKV